MGEGESVLPPNRVTSFMDDPKINHDFSTIYLYLRKPIKRRLKLKTFCDGSVVLYYISLNYNNKQRANFPVANMTRE